MAAMAKGVLETNFDGDIETRLMPENTDPGVRDSLEYQQQQLNEYEGSSCDSCMARIPYATLVATIMCILGVVVFCGTMHRGTTLAVLMYDQVFKMHLFWLDAVQMVFIIIGAIMGALGLMILTVGFLTTGATREKVYRAWGSRIGGRISCAVFMGITYILQLAWVVMFIFLVITSFVFTTFWLMCDNPRVATKQDCIDFTQFYFYFPEGHPQENMKVCGDQEIKLFCKDYVEKAEVMFILATVSCILIILSLIHYLMCLSANYAHIRDHEKMAEIQDLHLLTDAGFDKNRF